MDYIDVPSYFLCPISMQLMGDPVTVSTGITYDRENIERWLYAFKNNTCPVTKQVVFDADLTPNHTLRRLIQAWCTLNASHGIERIPTPKPPVDKAHIVKLLNDAKKSPHTQLKCLGRLRSIAYGSERNKKCLEAAGAVEFLASIIKEDEEVGLDTGIEFNKVKDEALSILNHIQTSETDLRKLLGDEGDFVEALIHVMNGENYQSRTHAIMLLKAILEVGDPVHLITIKPDFFFGVVHILQDQKILNQASKAALKLLVELCPWGRNRIKAVQAGAVSVLIELLLDTSEMRACELVLIVLNQLCSCAEGRAELLKHGAGLAVVSKKILRVSHTGTDRAVRILSSISRFSATDRVLEEMLQAGVVSKLCLVLQVDCSLKAKDRAKEILKLHSRVWKNSSCIPPHLLSSYPTC
ncbi:E3 ubiquitin-protein ligase PUB23-like [Cornus florida]|uniref:E3 ubiquitin-protein ligase PUB23-like n=1 Tax=Cornus florida TaxID=4283 RepID=UPI00289921B0|nr:E3 ubiquitin-protein ligase PUB23-like [Cornus florida]